jgi:hypothetical protein
MQHGIFLVIRNATSLFSWHLAAGLSFTMVAPVAQPLPAQPSLAEARWLEKLGAAAGDFDRQFRERCLTDLDAFINGNASDAAWTDLRVYLEDDGQANIVWTHRGAFVSSDPPFSPAGEGRMREHGLQSSYDFFTWGLQATQVNFKIFTCFGANGTQVLIAMLRRYVLNNAEVDDVHLPGSPFSTAIPRGDCLDHQYSSPGARTVGRRIFWSSGCLHER